MVTSLGILGLCGSLRAGSYSSQLLTVAQRLSPPEFDWSVFDQLAEIPPYNADLDDALGAAPEAPPPVALLRTMIAQADGIVITTPEYNHSIPGVLKNAIDWASRPVIGASLSGKCIAVAVVTIGRNSGMRCLAETKRILSDAPLANYVVSPEVVITEAPLTFSGGGSQIDMNNPVASRLLTIQLAGLAEAIRAGAADLGAKAAREAVTALMQARDSELSSNPVAGAE